MPLFAAPRVFAWIAPFLLLSAFSGPAPAPASKTAGTLLATGSMHTARASHTATLLPDGMVLIAGGFGGSGTESHPYASAELFDPASGSFRPGPAMVVARSGHAAAKLADGRVLLVGGWSGGAGVTKTAEVYDPAKGSFTAVGEMTAARGEATATPLRDGRVLITGGVDREDRALASTEIFDPRTNTFSPGPAMTVPRGQHTATALADGSVLLVGGGSCDCAGKVVYASAERFDPATGKFTPVGNLSTGRYKHTAVLLADGRVLVAGGSDARDWKGLLASAEVYDPASHSFRALPSMSGARFKFPDGAVRLQDGEVLLAGGAAVPEVFIPGEGKFVPVQGSLESPRYFACATLLRDGRVLVVGGYSEGPTGLPSTTKAWLYRP